VGVTHVNMRERQAHIPSRKLSTPLITSAAVLDSMSSALVFVWSVSIARAALHVNGAFIEYHYFECKTPRQFGLAVSNIIFTKR
jgi:hypothetical protein